MTYRVVDNLTEFSDDILLHILSNLNSWDLLNVLEVCQRLNKVGKDHSLWKKADFSDGKLTARQVTHRVLPCLQSGTKYLHLRGRKSKWKTDLLTPALAKSICKKSQDIQELHISKAIVNAKKFRITDIGEFKALKVFVIHDCEFINTPPVTVASYFKSMHSLLPNLESLEISKCNWITDYDLMVLSKLESLKKLILTCNLRIGFTMAYLSVSFRFGFKSLEELDLRGTSLQNSDIQSVLQSGKLKSLSIGPVGHVRRLSDEADDGLNLVMSDPHRREEPKQQVVVINMGPNGPNWRKANEEELDKMGLQWVKSGLNRINQNSDKEEEHYFFGKEGKIVKGDIESTSGECSEASNGSHKRKLSGEEEDEKNASRKRSKLKNSNENDCESLNSEDEEDSGEDEQILSPPPPTIEDNLPDKCLSDMMIHAFKDHAKNLQSLIMSGCAITNAGLLELVRLVPSLKYLDVTNSCVTDEGLQQAKVMLPECFFEGGVKVLSSER